MPGVVLLAAAIGVNYLQHRRHKPTICSTTRRLLPRPVAAAGITTAATWLVVHHWRGYPHT